MKVLQVITSLRIGGAEKLIAEMCPMYRERGIDVDILLFDGCDTPLKDELIAQGFNVYELARNKSVHNPFYIFKLLPFLRKYNIIHTHNSACQYFVAFAQLFIKSNAKFVTTEHNTHNKRRDMCAVKYVEKFVYKKYDSIIAISQKAADNLIDYLTTSRGVITINNGIDLRQYDKASPVNKTQCLNTAEDTILVTQVAGFREAKDQDTVIRSLIHLPQNIHACFVGDGVRRKACELLAEQLGVVPRVHFLGIRSDVPSILKCSDIVVMSSHYEGLSLSSVEGMAANKPMIASDVQGLREVVGGAGILFKQGDDKSLAKEISKLILDKEYYNLTSAACLDRAKQYDINIMADKYCQQYSKLLQPKENAEK